MNNLLKELKQLLKRLISADMDTEEKLCKQDDERIDFPKGAIRVRITPEDHFFDDIERR